jgi:NAD(P)H-dependent FMN reductase
MKVLAFAGSLRSGSFNQKLIRVAAQMAEQEGCEVNLVQFRQFSMPPYDADEHEAKGLPPGAQAMERCVRWSDAILLAAPEYNYSISGPLKNAIDWVSRARPMPWRGKSMYLMSASPSSAGGIRGLWQTRIPLEGCGAFVFPDMFALSSAHEAFRSDGSLASAEKEGRLRQELAGFLRLAEAVTSICGARVPPARRAREIQIAAALEDQSGLQPPG